MTSYVSTNRGDLKRTRPRIARKASRTSPRLESEYPLFLSTSSVVRLTLYGAD